MKELIEKLKANTELKNYSEEAIKSSVIFPILNKLGWNVFERDEVYPEYSTGSGRVDYALRIKSDNKVFIEAKSGRIEFNDNDNDPTTRQLLRYSFDEGVPQAFLTNGISWWFYLPLKRGNWKDRRIFTINIYEQETDNIYEKFNSYLGKNNVSDGSAIKQAEKTLEVNQRNIIINDAIPKVISKLFTDFSDEFFIELLADETEKQCGYKPDSEVIKEHLKEFRIEHVTSSHKIPEIKRPVIRKYYQKDKNITKNTWVDYCHQALKNLGGWAKLSNDI